MRAVWIWEDLVGYIELASEHINALERFLRLTYYHILMKMFICVLMLCRVLMLNSNRSWSLFI